MDTQTRHEPLKVLQGPGVPGDGFGSEHLKIYPGVVPGLNHEAREHGDARAVEKFELPEIQDNRSSGIDQRFLQHTQNRSVILRSTQTYRPSEKNRRGLLFELDIKGLSMNVFQADTPGTCLRGRTALVVTVIPSDCAGWTSKLQASWTS